MSKTEIVTTTHGGSNTQLSAFSSAASFEAAQRMALALCSSNIVPEQYRGKDNIGNAIVALEMAQRIGASPLAVMQNLNIIHGRPSWSSTFIIAALNSCGRFAPIRFTVTGEGDSRECVAWTVDSSGERLEGPPASIAMAKKEGWFGKNGSKWQTMPELMLRYRAAAFFGRLYAPDVLNGMHATEEVEDISGHSTRQAVVREVATEVLDGDQTDPPAEVKPAPRSRKAAPAPQPEPEAPTNEAPSTTDDGDIFG
jgi:hypothetical protein